MKNTSNAKRFISRVTMLMICILSLVCIMTVSSFAATANVSESSLSATHELLDWQPTAGSFWQSTGGINLSTADTPFNNQFIGSAVRFSKSDIPVGSYIFIDSGYRYRPEGWQNATGKNTGSRPDNVSAACVLVDEEWWGEFTLRAFQIQNTESSKKYTVEGDSTTYTWDLRENFDEAKNAFRIYVPKKAEDPDAMTFEWSLGFYDSTSSTTINTDGSDLSKKFAATQVFTKEQLPVGTVITIDSGYKYRINQWVDMNTKAPSRPENVYTASVTIDEAWWGDYNFVAFNISTSSQVDISENYIEVASHFNIILPDGTKIAHPKKTKAPEFVWTHGCYDSRSNSKIGTSGTYAVMYAASQLFTKEDIPVGSVITVDSGYYYRPEGWITLDTKNAEADRPNNVKTKSVTVTEEWWGDFTYRAFNVCRDPRETLTDDEYLEVASHFNITLPDGTKYVHPGTEEEEPEPEPDPEPEEPTNPIVIPGAEDGVLRLLSIGNSYSNDAQIYIAQIAAGLGIKCEFYNLYYGGCKIEQHYNFYNNDSAEYDFYKNMSKYVNTKVTLKNALEATQYDYITFQQGSYASDSYSTYALLDELMAIVRSYQPNAEFLIHQTWGYCEARACNGDETHTSGKGYATSADMFKKVEECYAQAAKDNGNLRILKSGKAVELAKTKYGYTDDYGKETSIYSDFNSHLAPDGDYLAGCVWIETIFGVDVRNTTYTGNFANAETLQEIAHIAVGNVYTGKVDIGANNNFGTPVIKTLEKDGFDYDGRARIVILKGTETVDIVYQNEDGTMPELELAEGTYKFRFEKNGYLARTTEEITVKAGDDIKLPEITMIAGDIKDDAGFCGDGVIDIDDFTRVLRGFDSDASALVKIAVDLNGDNTVNVSDLAIVKMNFSK